MALIKTISGIRGTVGGSVGKNLTPMDIVRYVTAYSQFLASSNTIGNSISVVLGREIGISGVMINGIVEGTLLGCGINVMNIGICTTSAIEPAMLQHKAQGGVFITSSNNPQRSNTIKLLNSHGDFFCEEDGRSILAYAKKMNYVYPSVDMLGVLDGMSDCNTVQIIQTLAMLMVDAEALKNHKFSFTVDATPSVQKASPPDDDVDVDDIEPVESGLVLDSDQTIEDKIQAWVDNKEYVNSNVTIQTMSSSLYTNRTYLSNHINRRYGCSFRDWILSLRINEAKAIIARSPSEHILDVAIEVGFSSPSSFSRAFARREGVSPMKWREKNINKME